MVIGFTYTFASSTIPVVSPGLFQSLAHYGSKLESITYEGDDGNGIPFVVLETLASIPSLRYLDVKGIESYPNRRVNEENQRQSLPKIFKQLLVGYNSSMDRNITTATSTTTIENLNLVPVYQMSYTMLDILGDLSSLQNLYISLVTYHYSDNYDFPLPSHSGYLNLDLLGVLELLRKGRKLRKVHFRGVVSYGKLSPSQYLKVKLVEQQQSNIQFRKYVVEPECRCSLSERLFESNLEIINIHYKERDM